MKAAKINQIRVLVSNESAKIGCYSSVKSYRIDENPKPNDLFEKLFEKDKVFAPYKEIKDYKPEPIIFIQTS